MLLALTVSGSGWAQNMNDVKNSIVTKYKQQDYAGALAELQPLANQVILRQRNGILKPHKKAR